MSLSTIAEAREDLLTTLSDTIYPVSAYDMPKVIGGAIVIDEAEPFIEYDEGPVFNEFRLRVNFNVFMFQDIKNLTNATKAMDDMVLAAVMNLGQWTLTNLESHFQQQLQESGPTFLVSRMSVTNILEPLGN